MIEFKVSALEKIKDDLYALFPQPMDYAIANQEAVLKVLDDVREKGDFFQISLQNLNYSYAISAHCSEKEFLNLEKSFKSRLNTALYEIGWYYLQYNPKNNRAIDLFQTACNYMKKNNSEKYKQSLISRCGFPFSDIYFHSVEMINVLKYTIGDFCKEFNVIKDTPFYNNLMLSYLAQCSKEILIDNEYLLGNLIASSDLEFLNPAIKNYTAKVSYEVMNQIVFDAIALRLTQEDVNETLGLSPSMLQRVKSLKFKSILENSVNDNSEKLDFYLSYASLIRNVELHTNSFFSVDIGNYIILDNGEWENTAYAYLPQIFQPLLESWKAAEYRNDYWPAINENEIITPRDVILELRQGGVIKLEFSGFELLYTKDLLSSNRF